MKKTEPYYLKYYALWMEAGRITERHPCRTTGGLCSSEIGTEGDLCLFIPDDEDDCKHPDGYWAYDELAGDLQPSLFQRQYEFTPLRQTIVLFLAAMNNEL